MNKLGCLIVMLVTFRVCDAQILNWEWARSIGASNYDYGYSIGVDSFGNVYTTGSYYGIVDFDPGAGIFNLISGGDRAIFVTKLDSAGNFIWAKSLSGTGSSTSWSIALDLAGNSYITGEFQGTIDFDPGTGVYYLNSAGLTDIFICKLDSTGNFKWARAAGGTAYEVGASISIDWNNNNDIYVAGLFNGTTDFDPDTNIYNLTSAGDYDVFILKLDSAGNFIWVRAIGGSGLDYCRSIAIDQSGSGNIYAIGHFEGTANFNSHTSTPYNITSVGNYDIFLLKLDASGNFLWVKQMGGAGFDKGMAVATDPNEKGNVYITGVFQSTCDFDIGSGTNNLTSIGDFDIFISKLNSAGDLIWVKQLGGRSHEYTYSIAIDPLNGSIYTTGYFTSTADFDPSAGIYNLTSAGDYEVFISKLDNSGNFLWTQSIAGWGTDIGLSIITDTYNHVFLTGTYYSSQISLGSTTLTNSINFGSTGDIFIAKLGQIITGISDANYLSSMLIYPNPFTDYINFHLQTEQSAEIILLDITGRVMVKKDFFHSISLFTGHIAIGIYFYEILSEKGLIATGKLIKE